MADGIEDEAQEDKELLSAMEELERAKQRVDQLRAQLGMKSDSDVVRAALDEYVQRHLKASA